MTDAKVLSIVEQSVFYSKIKICFFILEFTRPDSGDEGTTSSPPKKPKRQLGDLIKEATKQGKFYLGKYVTFIDTKIVLIIIA